MKIVFSVQEEAGCSILEATPGEIDGYPSVNRLRFSATPSSVSPDRIAVAGILAFGRYTSGQVQFEQKLSALSAEVIAKFMLPRWVHVTPLHPANLPIPRGRRTITLTDSITNSEADSVLTVVESDQYQGAIFGRQTTIIPSNAWLIDTLDSASPVDAFSAKLAVAVLMAEELDIAVIRIGEVAEIDPDELAKIGQLLGAVGLGLVI